MRTVHLSSYDSNWPQMCQEEINQLQKVCLGLAIIFHPIGSTAIPGCKAKPILDILGVVSDISVVDLYQNKIERLGYEAKGEFGMRRRRYFDRSEAFPAHLHIFEDTDPEVGRHLRFRNYLIEHPNQIKAYSDLKQQLAVQYPKDINRYCLGKTAFIKTIDRLAAWEGKPSQRIWEQKRTDWSDEEIKKSMADNLALQMTYLAKYLPMQEIVFEPDVTVVRSSLANDTFNYVLSACFSDDNVSMRIRSAISHYQKERLPFSWWVGEQDTPAHLEKALKAAGLQKKEVDVGMVKKLGEVKNGATEMEFMRVTNQKQMSDFASIVSEVSGVEGLDKKYFQCIPPLLYQDGAPVEFYVGYHNTVPVVVGQLVLYAQVAGIYFVITRPAFRRRGFATSLINHLLLEATEKKFHLAVLEASAVGHALYSQMGFRPVTQFVEYSINS